LSERGACWVRLVGALVLAALLVLFGSACGGGGGGKLGARSLSRESDSLRSLAAEGALLAGDVVSGRAVGVYVREHSAGLFKAAAEAALTTRRLVAIASRVRVWLGRLGGASKEEARALGRALMAAANESETIGEGLK
jgi:hypothetical protein